MTPDEPATDRLTIDDTTQSDATPPGEEPDWVAISQAAAAQAKPLRTSPTLIEGAVGTALAIWGLVLLAGAVASVVASPDPSRLLTAVVGLPIAMTFLLGGVALAFSDVPAVRRLYLDSLAGPLTWVLRLFATYHVLRSLSAFLSGNFPAVALSLLLAVAMFYAASGIAFAQRIDRQ